MKVCTKCKIVKEEIEFHKNKNTKDGLQKWCRICRHGYREANKAAINLKGREQSKKWYQENKKLHRARTDEWKRNNRDKVNEYKRNTDRKFGYWYNRNINKARVIAKKSALKGRSELRDSYVKVKLKTNGYTSEQIESIPELITIKKIQIVNKRINKPKK